MTKSNPVINRIIIVITTTSTSSRVMVITIKMCITFSPQFPTDDPSESWLSACCCWWWSVSPGAPVQCVQLHSPAPDLQAQSTRHANPPSCQTGSWNRWSTITRRHIKYNCSYPNQPPWRCSCPESTTTVTAERLVSQRTSSQDSVLRRLFGAELQHSCDYAHQAALHLQQQDYLHNDAIISPAHCTHACRTLRHESSYQFVRVSSTQLVMHPGLSNAAPWGWVDLHLRFHVDLWTTTFDGRSGPDSWIARLVIACCLLKLHIDWPNDPWSLCANVRLFCSFSFLPSIGIVTMVASFLIWERDKSPRGKIHRLWKCRSLSAKLRGNIAAFGAWGSWHSQADMPNLVTRLKGTPIQYLSGVRFSVDPRMETKKTRI